MRPLFRFSLCLSLLLLSLGGCGEDTIIVEPPADENLPPRIVAQGPDWSSPLTSSGTSVPVWVVVADPDGPEDIAAVILDIDRTVIHRAIVRPASSEPGCLKPSYVDNDTVPVDTFLPGELPATSVALSRFDDGPWRAGYPVLGIPDFAQFDFIERAYGYCNSSGVLQSFRIQEPLLVPAQQVFVTLIDLEFQGITVTAYDGSGESTVKALPDLRVTFRTDQETLVLP